VGEFEGKVKGFVLYLNIGGWCPTLILVAYVQTQEEGHQIFLRPIIGRLDSLAANILVLGIVTELGLVAMTGGTVWDVHALISADSCSVVSRMNFWRLARGVLATLPPNAGVMASRIAWITDDH